MTKKQRVKRHDDVFDARVVQESLSGLLPGGFTPTYDVDVPKSTTADCASGKDVTLYLDAEMPCFAKVVVTPVYSVQGHEGAPSYMNVCITRMYGLGDIFLKSEKEQIREIMLSSRVNDEVYEILSRFFDWTGVRIKTSQRIAGETKEYVWRIEPVH